MTRKLYIFTFGCQMNEADSELMAKIFRRRGFTLTDNLHEADAVIVNTCTVRQLAEEKAVSQIGRLKYWKAEKPEGRLFVTGCAAQRLGIRTIKKRFPYVDEVCGAKKIDLFESIAEKYFPAEKNTEIPGENLVKTVPTENIYRPDMTAYVTIMRGCSHRCSYCIVPAVRGPAVFLDKDTILQNARERIAAGAKEIVLLGQTVNSYRTPGCSFTNLLEEILALPGLERLRFMSPHPLYFDEEFFALLKNNKKLARHIHLPVQSGSDRILKLMRRGYDRKKYLDILARIRKDVPEIAFTTDFIVSYPGETEEDFQQTLKLVEEAGFSSAFCFKYSPRTDKPEMAADIPEKVTEERLDRLLKAVKEKSRIVLGDRIGKIEEMMFETPFFGKTSSNFAVRTDVPCVPGTIKKIEIVSAEKNTLHGKVIL